MNIKWMGSVSKLQLPKADIPSNAVKIHVDQSATRIAVYATILCVMLVILTRFRVIVMGLRPSLLPIFIGMLLSLLFLPIHELIHCAVYPIRSKMLIYLYRMRIVLFTTDAVSKRRYIVFLIAPLLVLGVLPAILWFVLPNDYYYVVNILYGFGFGGIGLSIGDIITLVSIVRKMPANSYFSASENDSYYFTLSR